MMVFGEIVHRTHFIVEKGFHPKDCLMILLRGSFFCHMAGDSFEAKAGDLVVFHHHTPFERQIIDPMDCILIYFDPFPCPLPDGILKFQDQERIGSTVSYLKEAVSMTDPLRIKHFTDDIFMVYDAEKPHGDPLVSACAQFLKANYKEAVHLDMLAEKFHISKQGLILKFKKYLHKTPMEYLQSIRISCAKNLLTEETLSIGEIAQKCGFENIYYFSNTFKKHAGMSPTAYRKNFRI